MVMISIVTAVVSKHHYQNQVVSANTTKVANSARGSYDGKIHNLKFSAAKYRLTKINVNGQTILVREYANIVYVDQSQHEHRDVSVYIPNVYFEDPRHADQSDAAVFVPDGHGGYLSVTTSLLNSSGKTMAKSGRIKKLKLNYIGKKGLDRITKLWQ